jgi:hypothetical protein
MFRAVLEFVLMLVIARSVSRLFNGMMDGLRGGPEPGPVTRVPDQGQRLVRDPVCGVWVLPDRAVSVTVGQQRHFFCSTACRDRYRSRTA